MQYITTFIPMLLAWVARRALELGGIVIAVEQVKPGAFSEIMLTLASLFTGQWHNVSLGTLIGIASTVGGLIWNGRSTFRPQVVDGTSRRILTEAEARELTGWRGDIEDRSR